jgi:hypothetical protein
MISLGGVTHCGKIDLIHENGFHPDAPAGARRRIRLGGVV